MLRGIVLNNSSLKPNLSIVSYFINDFGVRLILRSPFTEPFTSSTVQQNPSVGQSSNAAQCSTGSLVSIVWNASISVVFNLCCSKSLLLLNTENGKSCPNVSPLTVHRSRGTRGPLFNTRDVG